VHRKSGSSHACRQHPHRPHATDSVAPFYVETEAVATGASILAAGAAAAREPSGEKAIDRLGNRIGGVLAPIRRGQGFDVLPVGDIAELDQDGGKSGALSTRKPADFRVFLCIRVAVRMDSISPRANCTE